jgi:hypothetical protein
MISINALWKRRGDFRINDWLLDSGAFSQLMRHGRFIMSPEQYLEQIERWSRCGTLLAAVCQDWMCEPFALAKTGKTIDEHQDLTVASYGALTQWSARIMPVLQGERPDQYVKHIQKYGSLLAPNTWCGVGSICKRNGNPFAVEDVLSAIKQMRPDLRLHGFGLKVQSLERSTVRSLLYSADSMSWSYAGRRKRDANDPRDALRFASRIESFCESSSFIQDQLFRWWS